MYLLVRFTQGMDGLLGGAGMILTNVLMMKWIIPGFPKIPCVKRTSKPNTMHLLGQL